MRTRDRFLVILAAAAVMVGLTATAGQSEPASGNGTSIEDDLLQIRLNRLVAEAPSFGAFAPCYAVIGSCDTGTYAQISVIRLDTGEHAEVNGETGQVSLSSVKAVWVVIAVGERGAAAVEPYAAPIFKGSSNTAASAVIDLLGPQPSAGVDFINDTTMSWDLYDTWLRGWYGNRAASRPYPEGMGLWGSSNYTTPDELATFWVRLGRGELLDPADTTRVLQWAALPRYHESNELIPNRLPDEVAAAVAHKTGWSDSSSYRRIDGGLVTTPDGVTYAIVVSFKAGNLTSFYYDGPDWARYASCEVYDLIAGTDERCTLAGDPYSIRYDTTAPVGDLAWAAAERDQLRVRGWALDRDSGPDPIDVRITVDGTTVATIAADSTNTVVGESHGMGNHHGFEAQIDVDLMPGNREVCAVAINDSGSGPNPTVGCRTVTVSADHPPTGRLTDGFVDDPHLVVKGWASDADTSEPIDVKITVDGIWAARLTADRGMAGNRFRGTLPIPTGSGPQEVCAFAFNHEGAGPNRSIGCLTVEVPRSFSPTGALTAAYYSDAGRLVVRGWASDRDTPAPVEVVIMLDGAEIDRVTADRGATGDRFRSAAATGPGEHQVCATALDGAGGDPPSPLGCIVLATPPL